MNKFKVGDTVKYVAIDACASKPDGVIGKVVSITGHGAIAVLWEDGESGVHSDGYVALIGADPVSEPTHYKQGGIECIDAIRAALTPDEFRGYCKGNMLKYAWRERHKNGDEDLRKAAVYAGFATEARND